MENRPGTVVTALIQGPDRRGLISAITSFIFQNNGNIVYLDQHTDTDQGMFFMRVQFALEGFFIPPDRLEAAFGKVCGDLGMEVRIFFSDRRKRVAILASRQGHCLSDILWRWKDGHLEMELAAVVSNHEDLRGLADYYGVPFHHLPVSPQDREQQERELRKLLHQEGVDSVILARYMQVLSPAFVAEYPNAILNIHHSFLPAFVGANPYLQAFQRGVKVIGATCHYVTDELDCGPIVAQDVVQISHRDTVEDLKRKGQDIERLVLARGVTLHLGNRVIVHNNKTIIFAD